MVDKASPDDKFIDGRYLRFAKKYEPKGQLSVIDHSIMCVAGEGRLLDSEGENRLKNAKNKGEVVAIIAEYFNTSESHVRKLITKFKRGDF